MRGGELARLAAPLWILCLGCGSGSSEASTDSPIGPVQAAARRAVRAGDLLVANTLAHEILAFDPETAEPLGAFCTLPGLSFPTHMTYGPDGHLYVVCDGNNSVERLDGATGRSLGTYVASCAGNLFQPNGLAFGPDERLYVSCTEVEDFNAEVRCYAGPGEVRPGAFLELFTRGHRFRFCSNGLAFGADGRLYVAAVYDQGIAVFDGGSGALLTAPQDDPAFAFPADIVFGPTGRLYLTSDQFAPPGVVRACDPQGAEAPTVFARCRGEDPGALTCGQRWLYVAFCKPPAVERFDARTGEPGPPFLPPGTPGLRGPGGLLLIPEPAFELKPGRAGRTESG